MAGFLGVFVDECVDALDEGVFEALFDGALAPFLCFFAGGAGGGAGLLQLLAESDQPLGGVGPAVEQHIFDPFEQVPGNLFINLQQAGVDDAHVEAGLDRVVEKSAVHRLAHEVMAAKAEADIAHPAADLRQRKMLLNPAGGFDEVHRVGVVFLDAGADGEDIGIKNDVLCREAGLLREQVVAALTNGNLALQRIGLAALVEGHDHHRRAVEPDETRLFEKPGLPFLEGNRIDDALALNAFEASLDHAPFGGVDHDRHPGDGRFGHDIVQKLRHRRRPVQHPFVHVDVEDLRAAFHLLPGHAHRFLVVAREDEPGELRRAGDVGPFPDVNEVGLRRDGERVGAAQAQVRRDLRHLARRQAAHRLGDGLDVLRRRPATAANKIEQPGLRPLPELRGQSLRSLRESGWQERIGQAGVRISAHVHRRQTRKLLDVRAQLFRTEGTVQTDTQKRHVRNRVPERRDRLPGDPAVAFLLNERD